MGEINFQDQKKSGFCLSIISGIAWGTYGIFYISLVGKGMSESTIITLAALVNAITFLLVGVFTRSHNFRILTLKHYFWLLLSGMIAIGVGYSYAQAYDHGMPVGVVSVISFCNVIVLSVFSFFFFKSKLNFAMVVSIVLAVIGVALVLNAFGGDNSGMSTKGILWALSIPVLFASLFAIDKKLLLDDVDGNTLMFFVYTFATLLMLLLHGNMIMFREISHAFGSKSWITRMDLLGFAIIPTAICYSTWQEAYKRIEPTYVQIIYSLDPLTAFVLGYIFFHQDVIVSQVIGIVLILAAIANLVIAEGKKRSL